MKILLKESNTVIDLKWQNFWWHKCCYFFKTAYMMWSLQTWK